MLGHIAYRRSKVDASASSIGSIAMQGISPRCP
jgi:hypothetical protein